MASDAARPAPAKASTDARALEVRRASTSAQPSFAVLNDALLRLQAAPLGQRARVGSCGPCCAFCFGTASLSLNHAAKRPMRPTAPRTYAEAKASVSFDAGYILLDV